MVQLFLAIFSIVLGIYISSINSLNTTYLSYLQNYKSINYIDYENLTNLNDLKITYCSKQKEGGGSNLEGYCLKENGYFIPNGENQNLYTKVILNTSNGYNNIENIENGFIYIPNKNIIGNLYINEGEFKPEITGLTIGDTLTFRIKDYNSGTALETTDIKNIPITDNSSEEKVINSILQFICNDNLYCNGSTNYPGSIFNNYVFRLSDDKKYLNINIKNINHQIKDFSINTLDGFPVQIGYKKWQIEPLSK